MEKTFKKRIFSILLLSMLIAPSYILAKSDEEKANKNTAESNKQNCPVCQCPERTGPRVGNGGTACSILPEKTELLKLNDDKTKNTN